MCGLEWIFIVKTMLCAYITILDEFQYSLKFRVLTDHWCVYDAPSWLYAVITNNTWSYKCTTSHSLQWGPRASFNTTTGWHRPKCRRSPCDENLSPSDWDLILLVTFKYRVLNIWPTFLWTQCKYLQVWKYLHCVHKKVGQMFRTLYLKVTL